ncbi:MAG: L,D-transpeptidase family protein [Eubacteriales bacterium]|nr:L,D-transpeptidase family protein [Eubacteriales bacterium]
MKTKRHLLFFLTFLCMLFSLSIGVSAAKGWVKENGKTYYYKTAKQKYKGGPYTINGKKYLFKKNGVLLRSTVTRKNKKLYLSGKNGVLLTRWGTPKGGKGIYYGTSDGSLKTGVVEYKGFTYYFDKTTGQMAYGWQTDGNNTYYFDPKTGHAVSGWRKIDGKSYYFRTDGTHTQYTGWLISGNRKYYLDPEDNGARAYGTLTINGTKVNFGSEGSVAFTKQNMRLVVNRQKNVITVYEGSLPIKAILCSTGRNNATPTGTFRLRDKLPWANLNGPTIGQYCSHFLTNYLLHSVPMPGSSRNPYKVHASKYNMLGQQASQGCIRLNVKDARWIYYNVPIGSTITISDSAKMPLGKPVLNKMKQSVGADPTDTFQNPGGYSVSIRR